MHTIVAWLTSPIFSPHTRLDLSFTMQTLNQFMQNPSDIHFHALKHTVNYVAFTTGRGILLSATNQLKLHAFSDSDRTSCIDTHHSVTGYLMMLGTFRLVRNRRNNTISVRILLGS